jgi:hypothetical protein
MILLAVAVLYSVRGKLEEAVAIVVVIAASAGGGVKPPSPR